MSEAQLRFLIDAIRDFALFMLDAKGNVLSWNTGAERLNGYRAEEIIGRHFSCFYPAEVARSGHPARELQLAAESGRYEEEAWCIRKDGSGFLAHVVITAIRDEAGQLQGFAKVTRDVTESRQLERTLQEQATILDLADDTIFVRDRADRIIYWNRGAQRAYGWARHEAVGQITHTLLQTQFPTPLPQITAQLEEEGHWEGELRHTRRDGSQLTVASRWTLYQEAGHADRVIEMNHDITGRKAMELALQRKNHELQEAARAKDTFLANMSHELRTPLNAIIGFSELLADGRVGSVTPEQRECLQDVLNSSRHLLQLINDLLDLSKVTAGRMQLRATTFSPSAAADQVRQLMRPLLQEKGIRLSQHTLGAPTEVCLDEQRFLQILLNLLSNAVKFTDRGGEVNLTIETRSRREFALIVQDSGIGISAADLSRLFQDFAQLEAGSARRYQGTGLGLALTRKLVEMQHGSISVTSEVGRGSCFTVLLPTTLQEAASSISG